MAPGIPMFEPEVFRKQIYCIEESTCDIVGTFQHPRNCAPHRYAPDAGQLFSVKSYTAKQLTFECFLLLIVY